MLGRVSHDVRSMARKGVKRNKRKRYKLSSRKEAIYQRRKDRRQAGVHSTSVADEER
jgi:hypothetical protein